MALAAACERIAESRDFKLESERITMDAVEQAQKKRKEKVPAGTKTPLSGALRELPGGWRALITLFRAVKPEPEDDRAKVLAAYEEMIVTQATRPEEIADAAGISHAHLLGLVSETLYELQLPTAHIIRNSNFGELMKKTVVFAKRQDGFKDREMLFKGLGEVPLPQGATIINHPTAIAGASSRAAALAASDGGELTATDAPGMEDDTLRFTDLIREEEKGQIESPATFVEPTFTVKREIVPANEQ